MRSECMNDTKRSIRLLILAAACCFALVLIPASSYAQLGGVAHGVQQGVQTGAEEVQKGAEGTYNKGKEVITGEDQNQQQTEEQKTTPSEENRMKTTPAQSGTETETEQNQTDETGQKQMPRTAGELPLLVITGLL